MIPEGHVARLADRLDRRGEAGILSLPGCWDGLTLLLIEQAGFEAAFVSGAAVSMGALARPDVGYVGADRMVATVAAMRERSALSLIVDGDTGYGNALTLQSFVRSLERAGGSAVQIEDQTFPKRCGHMQGKQVVPIDEAVGRIQAALDAREHMLVIARTDAFAVEGFEAAMDRAERFVEAGADVLFIEGPSTVAQLQTIADRFAARVPLIHNLVDGGTTPVDDGQVLQDLGFAAALYPLLLMGGLAKAAPRWLASLRETNSTRAIRHEIEDLGALNRLTRADAILEEAKRYGG